MTEKTSASNWYNGNRIDRVILAVMVLVVAYNIYAVATKNQGCKSEITVEALKQQNEQLIQNNVQLLRMVQNLTISTAERNERDSLREVKIAANDKRLENTINRRLTEIDKNYEKTQAAIRNFNSADVGGYIANEAKRFRNMQQNRRSEDTNTKQ